MISFSRLACSQIAKEASFQGFSPNVLVIGAGGRLGQILGPKISQLGLNVFSSSRELSIASKNEIAKTLRDHNINVIVNAAVLSEGSREAMRSVNVDLPVRVAKAAQKEGLPFIQISTTATQVSGIGAHTPYAESKRFAEDELSELDNVKICRLDALVGEGSVTGKIDIGYMATGGIALHFKGGDSKLFQPTSYKAASLALANMAHVCLQKEGRQSLPSVINIAGDPVSISDFVRMLNEKAFELHISPEDLLGLAEIVQNGSLTPEFLHLAINSGKDPKVHCNAAFKELLGNEKLPTPHELAQEVNNRKKTLETIKSGLEIFGKVTDKPSLIRETLKVARIATASL